MSSACVRKTRRINPSKMNQKVGSKKIQTYRDLHVGKLCTAAIAPMLCERSRHEKSKWRQIQMFSCAALERSKKLCPRYGVLPLSSVTLIHDLDIARRPLSTPGARFSGHHGRQNVMQSANTKEKGGTYISRKLRSEKYLLIFVNLRIWTQLLANLIPQYSRSQSWIWQPYSVHKKSPILVLN